MKRQAILLFILFFPLTLCGQSVKVKEVQKISLSEATYFPSFGKSDNQLLLTSANYKGLKIYDLSTGTIHHITDAPGAGSNPLFTENDELLVSESVFIKGRKHSQHKIYSLDGEEKMTLKTSLPKDFPHVSVDGQELVIAYEDGAQKRISPVGDYYYIWPTFSTDKEKILFTAAGKGTYISDLNGNILHDLGYLNFPKWMNSQWVTGMADKDNGKRVTESDIIAIHIPTGKRMNLTQDFNTIATYPVPSRGADKIVFHTPGGEIYLMNIEVSE